MHDEKDAWIYYSSALGGQLGDWVGEYPFDADFINPWTGKPGRHRFDWAIPALKIAVEIDGGIWKRHGGRHGTDADRKKLAIAASMGWLVFRFSPQMLKRNPEICVRLVEQAIEKMRRKIV